MRAGGNTRQNGDYKMNNSINESIDKENNTCDAQLPLSIKAAWLSDAGHGWLSVANKDIAILKLEDVSSCSYMNATRSYLEEDCDAGIFFKKMENLGIEPDVKAVQPHWVERSFVRSLGAYDQYWINNPLSSGSHVYIPSIRQSASVVRKERAGWRIICANGEFVIASNNPFRYILPPTASNDN